MPTAMPDARPKDRDEPDSMTSGSVGQAVRRSARSLIQLSELRPVRGLVPRAKAGALPLAQALQPWPGSVRMMWRQDETAIFPAGYLAAGAIAWACLTSCGGTGMKAVSRDANGIGTGDDTSSTSGGALGTGGSLGGGGAAGATACAGDGCSGEGGTSTGSADSSAGDGGVGHEAAVIDLPLDVPWDGGSDAADSSTLDGGAGLDATVQIPQEIPSRQEVTFRVTNSTSVVRYLATRADGFFGGPFCSPYAISQGTTNLTLAIPSQCGCECPQPHQPGITELWSLSPGQTKDLVWDARALTTYSTMMTCGSLYPGGPAASSVQVLHGVWQPVAAGSYQATLITKTTVPTSCQETDEIVTCDYWTEDQYGAWLGGICDRTTAIKADFDLPAEGDVIVPITL